MSRLNDHFFTTGTHLWDTTSGRCKSLILPVFSVPDPSGDMRFLLPSSAITLFFAENGRKVGFSHFFMIFTEKLSKKWSKSGHFQRFIDPKTFYYRQGAENDRKYSKRGSRKSVKTVKITTFCYFLCFLWQFCSESLSLAHTSVPVCQ